MRKLGLAIAALALAGLVSSGAWAQSAKFDATWSNDVIFVKAAIADPAVTATCTSSDGHTGAGSEANPCILAEALMATLHVAQQKDLLIGVSAQIGLITFTKAKGKGGSETQVGEALASAGVTVTLELRDAEGNLVQVAAPGPVIFALRLQELKVGVTFSSTEFLSTVTVSLLLDTTAAHHFNFLGVDLDQGVYDVVAVFNLSAFVAIVGEDAIAEAEVILGPRMVTAQEVRAVKGSIDPLTP